MSGRKPVTVYDIASRLGYSPSTVSRVMNNSILVGSETRDRILRTAQEMGYQPRRIRRPEGRAILTVALIIPRYPRRSIHLFYDPAELVAGIESAFGGIRARVVVALAEGAERLFDAKKSADLDACVFAFSLPDRAFREKLAARGIPWIALNRTDPDANWIAADNAGGMGELIRRTAGRWGKRYRPCFIGFRPIGPVSEQRRAGFEAAATGAGTRERSVLLDLDDIRELSGERIRALRRSGVNAFHCFNDVMAVYLYQAALSAGIRIPEQASLTGFDASPVRELLTPQIDTVSLSVERLGREAGAWLRSLIIERRVEPVQLLVAGEYVEGDTIGAVGSRTAEEEAQ
ncbi:LacI family DNA-binding transcriptional regulator [Salinispira pacifica]